MKCCDLCGAENTYLADLRDSYQTEDMKHVCSDCDNMLNKKSRKISSITLDIKRSAMKRFMANMRTKLRGKV